MFIKKTPAEVPRKSLILFKQRLVQRLPAELCRGCAQITDFADAEVRQRSARATPPYPPYASAASVTARLRNKQAFGDAEPAHGQPANSKPEGIPS